MENQILFLAHPVAIGDRRAAEMQTKAATGQIIKEESIDPVPSEQHENVMRMFQEVCSSSICRVLKQLSGEEFDFQSTGLKSNPGGR